MPDATPNHRVRRRGILVDTAGLVLYFYTVLGLLAGILSVRLDLIWFKFLVGYCSH